MGTVSIVSGFMGVAALILILAVVATDSPIFGRLSGGREYRQYMRLQRREEKRLRREQMKAARTLPEATDPAAGFERLQRELLQDAQQHPDQRR